LASIENRNQRRSSEQSYAQGGALRTLGNGQLSIESREAATENKNRVDYL
jgi:hypothetical protein